MKITSQNRPAQVQTSLNRCHQLSHTVNFDIEYNRSMKMYQYESVDLEPGFWSKGDVIDAIVRSRYPQARMEAVVNNYLADQTEEALADMAEMQAWRRHAKEIAGGLSYE